MNNDYLTGLLTRHQLYDLYHHMEDNTHLHFMFIDLDNFKSVNDVYGHNKGDEFLIVFPDKYSRDTICYIAEQIIKRITEKQDFPDINTDLSASIGILFSESSNESLNDILSKSDIAMYYAKSHGKGQYIVYNVIAENVTYQLKLEKMQESGLKDEHFHVSYLPVIQAQTSMFYTSLVKLKWEISPSIFIDESEFFPIFERNGFIRELNLWTLDRACQDIETYQHQCKGFSQTGVLISKLLIIDNAFPSLLMGILESHQLKPSQVIIYISDSSFEPDHKIVLASLLKLKELGFSVSISHVGSNFSSMKIWDQLIFDSLHFELNFVRNSLKNERGKQILKTLISLGNVLKTKVIISGITTREHANLLIGYGCYAICGDYYSKPLSATNFIDYIADKLTPNEQCYSFPFLSDFDYVNAEKRYVIKSENVSLSEGISYKWGAAHFRGGMPNTNLLSLPPSIISESSYTISMWLYPEEANSWTSVIYGRFKHQWF